MKTTKNISQLVRDYIDNKPFLREALRQDIINFAALAEKIKHFLDKKHGTNLKHITVIQAIRRYQSKVENSHINQTKYGKGAEANLKTNLHMFTILRSDSVLNKLVQITKLIDFKSGGILHVTQGNYHLSLITNTYNVKSIKKALKNEKIVREDKNLVSISLKYSHKLIDVPGNMFLLSGSLAWDNITIISTVETMSETTFMVKEEDATRALSKLTQVMKDHE